MEIIFIIGNKPLMLRGSMHEDFTCAQFELCVQTERKYKALDGTFATETIWTPNQWFSDLRMALGKILVLKLIASDITTLEELYTGLNEIQHELMSKYNINLSVQRNSRGLQGI
jgi:hypothetical protein